MHTGSMGLTLKKKNKLSMQTNLKLKTLNLELFIVFDD